MLQVSIRPDHSLQNEAPEHPVQVRHLQQVVFQIVERGQAHRHDSQHGQVLPVQVVRKGVQVFNTNYFQALFARFIFLFIQVFSLRNIQRCVKL